MIFCFALGRGGRDVPPDLIRPSSVSSVVSPSCQATYLPPDGSTASATLVNSSSWIKRLDVLAVADVGELRSGEVGVEQQRAGAELGAGEDRLEEVAMVAAQDAEPFLGLEPLRPQGIGQRAAAPVELGEADRAELVDDRRAVAVTGGGQRDRAAGRAEGLEGAQGADQLVRRREDDAGAARLQQRDGVSRLGAGAGEDLAGRVDDVHSPWFYPTGSPRCSAEVGAHGRRLTST